MSESISPLLLVESKSKWKEIGGIVVGLKRALRKLRYITDTELLKMSEDEYKELLGKHDYLLTIDLPSNVEKLSYFPLDMRNQGCFTMNIGSIPWPEHNYDVFILSSIPGILPYMIRILSNKG
jgi:hypothetical protein